ncbi:hypothetical protein DEU56DRAFT_780502 [Suillus clintonianus]|uniref:uncharacterized protein n=1 Tax=Suillus clintonianus TaxID=1904413 RepID=UPI001B872DB2|nr:uncharacterized protein DEU56DRAFT_780502 [Suillus clintonianus]KAG2150524.1 hypothetical protein DEU56DRAFT_780502 [Suillus clintonianus]
MKDLPHENLPPILPIHRMAETIAYSSTPNAYIPPASYYPPSHAPGHPHVVAPQPRQEPQQRKRPKYTRSKTGCMTCRVKKIKCDEAKPNCMRCTHGQRDCTWPEGVPARKKSTPRKDSIDGRPSTADSSGLSETSTPPTRDSTPPKPRVSNDYNQPPMSRRHSDLFAPVPQVKYEEDPNLRLGPEPDAVRRQLAPQGYPVHPNQNSNVLSMISEMQPYPPHRYDSAYANPPTHLHSAPSRHIPPHHSQHHVNMRSMNHQPAPPQHWSQPHMMSSVNPMDSFFPHPQERNLVAPSSNDHHPRYP